jgi:hypothetical protein
MSKARHKATHRLLEAAREPILDMANIQGIAVPGFLKPQHSLLYVRFPVAGRVCHP